MVLTAGTRTMDGIAFRGPVEISLLGRARSRDSTALWTREPARRGRGCDAGGGGVAVGGENLRRATVQRVSNPRWPPSFISRSR